MGRRVPASPQLFQIKLESDTTVAVPASAKLPVKLSQVHYVCSYYVEQKKLPAEPCWPAEL